ncbi:MAG: hypothetical protein ABI759_14720 [Candidatus Solibacter sp.]
MAGTNPHPHPNHPNDDPRIQHETTDVNVWAVGKFAIGLVVITVLSLVLLFGLFKFFQNREETEKGTVVDTSKVFPEPRLQRTPIVDLKAIRAEEDKLLNGYAWVDQQKGIVRIPVDVAIDVLAKRGLPSRPATTATPTTVTPDAAPAAPAKESSHTTPAEEPKK